ncbi:MAG: hypothetical protein ACFHHU_00215 [Porticoccaceae bacterium]
MTDQTKNIGRNINIVEEEQKSPFERELHHYDWGDGKFVIYDEDNLEIGQVGFFGGGRDGGKRDIYDQDQPLNATYAQLFVQSPKMLATIEQLIDAIGDDPSHAKLVADATDVVAGARYSDEHEA